MIKSEESSAVWLENYFNKKETDIIYSESERQALIYLMSFSEIESLSVFHFQDFLKVSKNTILADIKKLRNYLSLSNLELTYSRKNGFTLSGTEKIIQEIAYKKSSICIKSFSGKWGMSKWLFLKSFVYFDETKKNLIKVLQDNELKTVPSRIDEMIYFICFTLCRGENHTITYHKSEKEFLGKLVAYQASQQFLENYKNLANRKNQKYFYSIIFMTLLQGEVRDSSLNFLVDCSMEIIKEMQRLTAIEFSNQQKLLLDVFHHLVPAYFRLKYHFPLSNVLIEQIKQNYSELFIITQLALHPLEKLVGKKLSEHEVGYFTILFGGQINKKNRSINKKEYRGIILCPSGLSSSLIMKSELKELFPTINLNETYSIDELDTILEEDYDIIFSSVWIETKKPLYVINPIMSDLEKNNLVNKVQKKLFIPGITLPSIDKLVEAILPYVDLKKGVTKEKLFKVLNKKIVKNLNEKEDGRPMLSDLLTSDMIQISNEEMKWEEAIELAAQPLLNNQKIEKRYIEAMINKVKEYGAFIHIGKGVALPHARPEDGVNEIGMSLLKVNQPVLLLDDEKHAIQVFICLAAVDDDTHLKALASLTKILSNNEKLNNLLKASTKEEIKNLLIEGEE